MKKFVIIVREQEKVPILLVSLEIFEREKIQKKKDAGTEEEKT